ncbi:NAD(P)H-dependent oxidoreductase [Candidatus Bathyarchaeota archaeon]|nr:NAD(P)H-dependent oxidoreductase [Candidatus Bathyarchaeota archaeon]MBL7080726.1 NAD(P)H-dependent oxidoreductase [Candidatus Bathyarchaeota archaeon]
MANAVSEGVEDEGIDVEVKRVDEASIDDLPMVDGVILGSPVYYGLPSAKMKQYIDESVKYHGKLDGKVGGAFASAGGSHTGAETTIIALNEALFIHGMVVQGTSGSNHYGAASVGAPDEKDKENCRKLGARVARLVKKLNS